MARKHGWQLPAHTLQIVAITVFFLLVVAFYAFFAPFLGTQVIEYVAIGVYTPVALAVFILYIRCTSINPADPGIMSKFEDGFINIPANSSGIEGMNLPQKANNATGTNSPTSTCRSSLDGHSNHRGSSLGETNINLGSQQPKKRSSCWLVCGLLCAIFVKEDCRRPDDSEQQANGEEALFCTLCNAEVRKFSKHCRSCDKCVDGFDHHCRWLNNCVGADSHILCGFRGRTPRFVDLESSPSAHPDPVEMSRAHDGHRSFFPVGNPFRMVLPRGAHLSPKLTELLASYEDGLASSLRKLKPEVASDVLTLSWMRLAMDCLSELHAKIATLITELELPVSDWDEKWVDIYLNSSVKLLDICIALSSELARLDQGQLLVQYVLHILDSGNQVPSQEQLKRAEASLKEWMERSSERSPRLDNCLTALQALSGNLCLMKVKHSAKGKVLMRALYGIEAVTVFICSVLVAVLSGSSKPLVELDIPEKFGWSKAFNDLHKAISGELSRQLSGGQVAAVKELEEVEVCARQLHALTKDAQLEEENASLAHAVSHPKEGIMSDTTAQEGGSEDSLKLAEDTSRELEVIMLQSVNTEEGMDTADIKEDAKTISHTKEVMVLEGTNYRGHQDGNTKQATGIGSEISGFEMREELLNCISSMSKSTQGLRLELDSLSKRVGDFFQIVLTGRDALLCNLRISNGNKVAAEVRS